MKFHDAKDRAQGCYTSNLKPLTSNRSGKGSRILKCMKKALIALLTLLFSCQHLSTASAQAETSFQLEIPAEASLALAVTRLEQYQQIAPPDRTDLWMNATYALGSSALSNTLLLLVITGLTLGQEALAPDAPAYLDLSGAATLGLLVVPMVATPLLMHAWSPEAEWEHFNGSVIGSVAMTGAQLVLMTPLFVIFNQGNINDTYWALLPTALITSILFQALGSAWGHELSQNLVLSSVKGQGLQLSYQLKF